MPLEAFDRIAAGDTGMPVPSLSGGHLDTSPGHAQPTPPVGVDRDAFLRWLHAEYAGRLLSLVRRVTDGDMHWAEDVVQETLLRAWRNADLLMDGRARSLLPWLATVARRIAINDRRSRAARPREVGAEMLAIYSVEDESDRAVQRAVIADALDRLTPAHRSVLIEAILKGRPLDDVARSFGVPIGTVKSRIHYALRALRGVLHADD